MGDRNEGLLRQAYEAFAKGDMATIDNLWADDIVYHVHGSGPLSGDYHGKQAAFEMFGRIPEESDAFGLDVHDILANDEHAVALVEQTIRRGDQEFTGPVVQIVHVNDDGKFTEVWFQPIDESALPEGFWE